MKYINNKLSTNSNLIWFIEGLYYSTIIALLWSNEEPSKLNTLLVSWTCYAIIAAFLFGFVKNKTITNPSKWIRVYFIQCFLFLIVCDFIWLQGHIPRTTDDAFDTIRFDAYSVILAKSGMKLAYVSFQNFTGTIWYAGFIYYIFGVSKFYVALFNSVLTFIACGLFVSVMGQIEGNYKRWQWLRFGMLIPDFIFHFPSVSKEPLCTFFIALGVWLVTKLCTKNKRSIYYFVLIILTALLGFSVRAAVLPMIFIVGVIFYMTLVTKQWKRSSFILLLFGFMGSLLITTKVSELTGAMGINYKDKTTKLLSTKNRLDQSDEILLPSKGSWNVITESSPIYLMPIVAPAKGLFMMLSPLPYNFNIYQSANDIVENYFGSKALHNIFTKITSLFFIMSFPLLLAATFDIKKKNRVLWFIFPFTFFILISFMGFASAGTIQPRYRPMLLLYWLVTSGIGYFYGKPKNYILPSISIGMIGIVIFQLPKIF